MSRGKNSSPSRRLSLRVSIDTYFYLEALVKKRIYGKTAHEVGARIIDNAVADFLEKKIIEWRKEASE